jgi:hypothetical protein
MIQHRRFLVPFFYPLSLSLLCSSHRKEKNVSHFLLFYVSQGGVRAGNIKVLKKSLKFFELKMLSFFYGNGSLV